MSHGQGQTEFTRSQAQSLPWPQSGHEQLSVRSALHLGSSSKPTTSLPGPTGLLGAWAVESPRGRKNWALAEVPGESDLCRPLGATSSDKTRRERRGPRDWQRPRRAVRGQGPGFLFDQDTGHRGARTDARGWGLRAAGSEPGEAGDNRPHSTGERASRLTRQGEAEASGVLLLPSPALPPRLLIPLGTVCHLHVALRHSGVQATHAPPSTGQPALR